ncbi:Uncharacterised protein [Candidatus Bilamarchaeum dharawalense]|uniref:Uncharacterized protein n=1 Tax=Candidatus Bilamarchaeum dharawalense TaxID=2885759 RepID=A0A5E4LMG4_9ARCH|nr:Uncharacterised protein [Candidatus Bilamarchaeum dharawalense]
MSDFVKGCPECSMSFGMSSALSKADNEFRCTANPAHKFKLGNDGFLQSI